MKRLIRRLTNNIRVLEHLACAAEGPAIDLIDDLDRIAEKLGRRNELADRAHQVRRTIAKLQNQTDLLHEAMSDHAANADLEIPTENVVNGPGTK